MGALRTQIIEEMKLRNFSPRTQQSYLSAMVGLVKHYRRSPVDAKNRAYNRLEALRSMS
jgi:Phage integrase, N-terminal SAM-like domain